MNDNVVVLSLVALAGGLAGTSAVLAARSLLTGSWRARDRRAPERGSTRDLAAKAILLRQELEREESELDRLSKTSDFVAEEMQKSEREAKARLDAASAEAKRQGRRADELFAVVEKVLAERDQWREMWRSHGLAHLEAQNMLEQALVQARTTAVQAIRTVNKYRESSGQPAIPFGVEPNEKPVGSAAKFKELLDKAEADAPEPVNGLALRDEAMREHEPSDSEACGAALSAG